MKQVKKKGRKNILAGKELLEISGLLKKLCTGIF